MHSQPSHSLFLILHPSFVPNMAEEITDRAIREIPSSTFC